jgi:hypothetical protein
LRERLAPVEIGDDLIARSLIELGYAALHITDRRVALFADAATLRPITFAGACDTLTTLRPERIALVVLGLAGGAEIFRELPVAIERLDRLCRERSLDPGWSSFASEPQSIAALTGPACDAVHLILAEWAILGRGFDAEMRREFLDRRMAANSAIAVTARDGRGIVFVAGYVPSRRLLGQAWVRDKPSYDRGIDLRKLPDLQYGLWLSRAYFEVLESDRPRLDRIRTRLCSPALGCRHFDYDRLLLPWLMPDGERIVTLTSVLRAG